MIYKDKTDITCLAEDYRRDYKRFTSRDIERIDPDSKEGATFCEIYDIVQYPTILAIDINGSIGNLWRGLPLPLISEVGYYHSRE